MPEVAERPNHGSFTGFRLSGRSWSTHVLKLDAASLKVVRLLQTMRAGRFAPSQTKNPNSVLVVSIDVWRSQPRCRYLIPAVHVSHSTFALRNGC